jgi:iron complex outermembrane receptor protein
MTNKRWPSLVATLVGILLTVNAMAGETDNAVPGETESQEPPLSPVNADNPAAASAPVPAIPESSPPPEITTTPISEPKAEQPAQSPAERTTAESELVTTVIVTANKIEQQPKSVTQSVRVIAADTWEQYATTPTNISLLTQLEPGQFVNPLSHNDANWGSAAGLGPSYFSYLLDGLPIDTFVDAMSLDPWAFTRIEEQRGPASIMYGNYLGMDFAGNESPLAGVTNFILKDRIERSETRLLAGGGSWGTAVAKAFHQDHTGNFHYFFGSSYERSDYTNYGTAGSWLHILHPPQYSDLKIYGKGTWFFDRPDHEVSLFVHHNSHSGNVGRPNRDFDHNYNLINAVYSNMITEALGIQAKVGLRLYDRRWGEDNYSPDSNDLSLREHDGVRQKVLPIDITVTHQHLGESLLTAGIDGQLAWYQTYSEVDGVQTKGNDASAGAVGLFAQEKFILGDWVLRAGGRYNHSGSNYSLIGGVVPSVKNKSWDVALWSAGVRFNGLGPVSLYTNAGSSFVTPSAKAVGGTLRASDQGVAGKSGQLPNPNLKPQSGIGVDLGADIRIGSGFRAGVRGFFNNVSEVIVDNVVSQDPSQTKSVNAGTLRSYGVEVSADQVINRFVQWFANLTWTGSRIGNDLDPDQDGASVTFVPNVTANVGLTLRLPGEIMISPFVTVIGDYYDSTSKSGRKQFGPYAVLSTKIQKAILLSDLTLIAAVDLNNMTNNKYEMPWQFQNPGFSVLGTLEVRH